MLATSILTIFFLSSGCLGWEWGRSGKWDHKQRTNCHGGESTINYTTITGFFQQDDPATDSKTFDYTTTNYGLLNRSYLTGDELDPHGAWTQWERFTHFVDTLNRDADKNTQYKVLFMGRHGEGYHNAAESFYGTPAWNCYWGLLDGNTTTTWRDALLTPAGIAQCTKAHAFWSTSLSTSKIPAPQSYYSSPLLRSATTANLTFAGLTLPADRPFAPVVKELLREGISIRACDERSNRTHLRNVLPPEFIFEEGFTENDELWRGDEGEGETSEAQVKRSKVVLDDIFSNDDATWVSITSHSGEIAAILKVLGHRTFSLNTGQAIPVLVKAVNLKRGAATTTVQSWSTEATCSTPPVTSITGQGCVCSSSASLASVIATTTATATSV
ncbi:phosphoglycerate mutase-like protein [Hypoxylon trugodes]|uniref:phosphoglycerate mutase-like protein n=1 Tax=Hypoxylon trugodes TaxID=326681 RepID=UPI0021976144|nr:phosphoglycerate mutase-like protein [Hypoxylon trugodes]KAI1387904.1 phosphoglycerate mutase-like protein [Hypoxylon trugodes]